MSPPDGLHRESWLSRLVWMLLLAVLLPSLLVLAAVCVPIVLIVLAFLMSVRMAREWGREAALRRRLAGRGRALSRSERESRIRRGEGTVIVEMYGSKGSRSRVWWTPDDVVSLRGCPVRSARLLKLPPMSRRKRRRLSRSKHNPMLQNAIQHPWIQWCRDRYVDELTGSAHIVPSPCSIRRWRKKLSTASMRRRIVVLESWMLTDWRTVRAKLS